MDELVASAMTDNDFMSIALSEAHSAGARGEVPIGAVLVDAHGKLLARDGNRVLEHFDPTAHAEILVLRAAAGALRNERLVGTALFVTLEPCAMCVGAISAARVARLVFAADDPKGGAVEHGPRFFEQPTCHHRPAVSRAGNAEVAGEVLRSFFRTRRPQSR